MVSSNHATHILVVEDDRDVRETVVEVLEDEGYSVSAAADGSLALAYLASEQRRPDLILLDLMMPNMNGYQFREHQLKNPTFAAIPIAVFTADGHANDKVGPLNAAAFVRKPLKIDALLEVVTRVLREH
ncbi:MAG: response regulator [Kofleriaceae bacterium]